MKFVCSRWTFFTNHKDIGLMYFIFIAFSGMASMCVTYTMFESLDIAFCDGNSEGLNSEKSKEQENNNNCPLWKSKSFWRGVLVGGTLVSGLYGCLYNVFGLDPLTLVYHTTDLITQVLHPGMLRPVPAYLMSDPLFRQVLIDVNTGIGSQMKNLAFLLHKTSYLTQHWDSLSNETRSSTLEYCINLQSTIFNQFPKLSSDTRQLSDILLSNKATRTQLWFNVNTNIERCFFKFNDADKNLRLLLNRQFGSG